MKTLNTFTILVLLSFYSVQAFADACTKLGDLSGEYRQMTYAFGDEMENGKVILKKHQGSEHYYDLTLEGDMDIDGDTLPARSQFIALEVVKGKCTFKDNLLPEPNILRFISKKRGKIIVTNKDRMARSAHYEWVK